MDQLCASCSYPQNICDTCPIAINYLSAIPFDYSISQGSKTDLIMDTLEKRIIELIDEIQALKFEVQELKLVLTK